MEEEQTGANRHGALAHGSGFLSVTPIQVWRSNRVLSVGLDSGRKPTSLCSQGGGGLLAPAGPGLAKIPAGDGILGEGQ